MQHSVIAVMATFQGKRVLVTGGNRGELDAPTHLVCYTLTLSQLNYHFGLLPISLLDGVSYFFLQVKYPLIKFGAKKIVVANVINF